MSLVAHWKFENDTTDSIGSNDGSGSPNYVDGKLGRGIDGDGSTVSVDISGGIESALNGNHMTFSMWWRQYDNNTYRWNDAIELNGTRLERGRGDDGNSEADYWCNFGSGDGNQLFDGAVNGIDGTEWFHIVVRRNGDDYEVWINGELNQQGTRTEPMSQSGTLDINYASHGAEIDDVRLYDHAISEKKIVQLSQAKILHYKFDNFAEPTKNRSKGSGNHDWRGNHSSNTITETDSNAPYPSVVRLEKTGSDDQWHGQHGNTDTYSLSVDDYVSYSGWYKLESGAGKTNLSATNYEADGWSSHGGDSYTMENDGLWNRFEMTAEITGDSPSGEYQPAMQWGYSTNQQSLELCGVQIETKDHATPFVNGTREGTVTDSSGQGNDAQLDRISTPQHIDSSKIGSGAYEFDGSNNWVDIGDLGNPGEGSISLWFKKDNTNTQYLLDGRTSGSWWFLTHYNGGEINIDNRVKWNNLNLNEWYHVVATVDSSETKLYVNGDLKGTGSGFSIDFSSVRIAARYSDSSYLSGSMDDVRLYASALSASEVQEVYEQRASIDSGGNLHGHELSEQVSSGLSLEAYSRGNNS